MKIYVIYRHFNKDGELLYVGCTGNVFSRTQQHLSGKNWYMEIFNITIEHFSNRKEALKAESIYQKTENPKYCLATLSRKACIDLKLSFGKAWLTNHWKITGTQELINKGIYQSYFKRLVKLGFAEVMETKNRHGYKEVLYRKAGE